MTRKLLFAVLLLQSLVVSAHAEDIIFTSYPTNMMLDEAGGIQATVEVRINVQPTGNIYARLFVPSPLDEVAILIPGGFLATSKGVVFTPADWSPKFVTLVGVDDALDDGLQPWQVQVGSYFNGGGPLTVADVSGDNRFLGKGPWIGNGHTCDNDGGNDICETE